jgi:hypothetical protein
MMRLASGALLVAIGLVAGSAALANGFLENRPYQFDTASDKIAKVALEELRQLKKGGFFDGFGTTVNNSNAFTTNVFGDQISCSVSSSAVGNVGTQGAEAITASPTGVGDSDIFAEATGNVATNSNTGNESDGGSVDNPQSNTTSPQTASTDGSSILSSIGGDQTLNGTSTQTLNSTQENFNSPVSSSVTGSTACLNP